MKHFFLDKNLKYDGRQLRSHWIFEQTGFTGDAVAAFCGAADVPLENMVDLVDVAEKAPIASRKMLHFIIEHFGLALEGAILSQRLFCAITTSELAKRTRNLKIERTGDDIYEGDKKLSVSIATISLVSSLIHFGINIDSKGTPVPTKGLADYKIDPKTFAEAVMRKYVEEMETARVARCKVRAVA